MIATNDAEDVLNNSFNLAHSSNTGTPHIEEPINSSVAVDCSSSSTQLKQVLIDKLVFFRKRKPVDQNDQTPPQNEPATKRKSVSCPSEPQTPVVPIAHTTAPSNTVSFPDDISNFVDPPTPLTDQKKYHLLCNVWKPQPEHVFPANVHKRKFLFEWLKKFPWLAYSKACDGAFCVNCVLFGGESTHNASKLQRLFKTPLNTWNIAASRFRVHEEKSPIHKTATLRASLFKTSMEQRSTQIDAQLNELRGKQIEENRKKLKPIVEGVVLLGRQAVALRGHRDDSKDQESETNNPGNLIEVLKYGARCAGVSEHEFLNSTPKNATYRSKTTQNQIIEVCGELISEKIVSEVHAAKFFSILADEATDCSNIEQMSLVVRFVDKEHCIREEFLGFVPCSLGMTGEAISTTILNSLGNLGLSIENCRGQGYDGAGNMAGRLSGAAARIKAIQSKAIYIHCNSHILNLCVATCCKQQLVRNMMDTCRVTSEFYNFSPKRFALLEKIIKELCPRAQHSRLIDACKTRWIARLDALAVFVEVFIAIVRSLEEIRNNEDRSWNSDSTQKASGLYHSIVSFQFLITLIVVSRCLEVSRPLTLQLQHSAIDAGYAREKVELLYVMLEKYRAKIEEMHGTWFQEAETLAQSVGTEPGKPRTTGRQKHRANVPAESVLEYYRRVVSIPFLDHLLTQIQTRFSETNLDIMDALYGLPKNVLMYPNWKTHFTKFLDMYRDDLPNPRLIENELDTWSEKLHLAEGSSPTAFSDLLAFIDQYTFPNIYRAFQIFATIPVTTCTCERSISSLRRLKTYLRSRMNENRLKGLALLCVHRELRPETDKVIDRFATKHPRRMTLTDISNDE